MKPDSPPVFYVGLDVAKAALQLDLAGPSNSHYAVRGWGTRG
ncbi:MAG: hypothetical protein WCO56_29730 [Verrucomicrobiota bacterium]